MAAKEKEAKVFAVYGKDGELTKLVEAHTPKQVRDYLLRGQEISVASALTVARSKLEVERA